MSQPRWLRFWLTTSFALWGLFLSSHSLADLQLNGLAQHSELNQPLYIGAIYTNEPTTDADTLLRSSPLRMELRVVGKRLSPRRLNSQWIEGMAINNPSNLLAQEAENMALLSEMIKHSLKRGDTLAITGTNDSTEVTLNGVALGNIASARLFRMLLRTWIGPVPLSSEFRSQLLTAGEVNESLLAKFDSLVPTAERVKTVATWPNSGDIATTALGPTSSGSAPSIDSPNIQVLTIQAPSIQAPAIPAPSLSAAPTAEPESAESPLTEESQNTGPQDDTFSDLGIDISATNAPALAIEPELTPVAPAPAGSPSTPVADNTENTEDELTDEGLEEEQAPALTAETILLRQRYLSDLIRWTYKNIRYPRSAERRGQEGNVRLAVEIDRGGKLLNVAVSEASEFDALNEEALKAVRKSSPYPPVPDVIVGKTYQFTLPIVFRLPD